MTLILAIPAREGVVLASDGQVTTGPVRASGRKLFRLNQSCAWGGAGEVALVQRVQEAIGSLDQPLEQIRDHLANTVRQCVTALLNLDFRTPFFQGKPDDLLSLHPGDFVFVEARNGPRLLHITSYGTPEWIDRPFAIGSGALFAYALLRKYQGMELEIGQAALLAFKVIEEAVEVGAYGLGLPIEVWKIVAQGVEVMEDGELAALGDAVSQLREGEIQLLRDLPGGEAPRADEGS